MSALNRPSDNYTSQVVAGGGEGGYNNSIASTTSYTRRYTAAVSPTGKFFFSQDGRRQMMADAKRGEIYLVATFLSQYFSFLMPGRASSILRVFWWLYFSSSSFLPPPPSPPPRS